MTRMILSLAAAVLIVHVACVEASAQQEGAPTARTVKQP